MADTEKTTHPLLTAFFKAQYINLHSGGAVVAPWELEPGYELEDWTEAAMTLSKVPGVKARKKAQEDYILKFRKEHAEKNKRLH